MSAQAPDPIPAEPAATDGYSPALLDARLGREPQDVIEAAIVLEAWDGRPARQALTAAGHLVRRNQSAVRARGQVDPVDDLERSSVFSEALALMLSIVSVAVWASPLSAWFGPSGLAHAIQLALPLALGVQWALRSRYLGRRRGLALLGHDTLPVAALLVLIDLPLTLAANWGVLAALMVTIWSTSTILTRRGWGLVYALAVVAATVALHHLHDPYVPLGALASVTMLLCAAALLTRRAASDDRCGSISRALAAGMLGGCIGVLLVADPSLGWGVRGAYPALALLPAVIGSFWAGHHLWDLYDTIPRGLRGVPLEDASRVGFRGPAMQTFLGALLRLAVATTTLSGLLLAAGGLIGGTDAASVFLAFGCASLITMVLSLMESLSLQRDALLAIAAALTCEALAHYLLHWHLAGGPLAAGATVGLLLTTPRLLTLLSRSGRVLATTLWIR